ncbi:hypothetical protein [Catenulispora pinisilvae]|uniref:hypothetical protein n=1 Tax=Catenulispora pinisilvae TaxID=2705253 RepID=UPI0018914BB6|nr:hypothetical protein [Catenulispora pinisilvae]
MADLSGPDTEVFAAGLELARDRFAALGQSELLPQERVFMAVASTAGGFGGFHDRLLPRRTPDDTQAPGYRYVQAAAVISRYGDRTGITPAAPGMVGADLLHAYVHDCCHFLTFRSYRLGADDGGYGIHRSQHGINFRRASGSTYSSRDPQGSTTTRNLGVIMEGAFDVDATTVTREAVTKTGLSCPPGGIDHHAFLDAVGEVQAVPATAPWLESMNGYVQGINAPYDVFLSEVGGPDSQELHEVIITATLGGNLVTLQSWLDERYGPGEFTALFRSETYAA